MFNKTGVYIIENIKNGKYYVGSTSKSFAHRWGNHINMLRKNKHHSIKLQRAFNKYGENSFKFRILEVTELDKKKTKEQYWMDKLNPFYNMILEVNSATPGMTGKKHTKKTKIKMSNASKGVSKSKKHRKSISDSMKKQWKEGKRKLGKRSEISKIKQSRTKFNGVLEVYKNQEYIISFYSIKECSKELNLNYSSIQKCLSGKRNSLFNYTFIKKPLVKD